MGVKTDVEVPFTKTSLEHWIYFCVIYSSELTARMERDLNLNKIGHVSKSGPVLGNVLAFEPSTKFRFFFLNQLWLKTSSDSSPLISTGS